MISENKSLQVYKLHTGGVSNDKIAKDLNMKENSVRRYIRAAKHLDREGVTGAKGPRVLLYDIETLMMEVYVWDTYKQYIPDENIIKNWSIVSWSAKWLYESKTFGAAVSPEEAIGREDRSIIKELWSLIEEADILVGYNSERFDIRKINMRWLVNGLGPTSPFRHIDLMKVAKRNFSSPSYKLNYFVQLLTESGKIKTEYNLWKRCVSGDQSAIDYMLKYNKRDVVILEDFYEIIAPWINSVPTAGLYSTDHISICPTPGCGSEDLDWSISPYYTTAGRFRAFRCRKCGSIGRSRFSDLSKEEREALVISTAR